MYTWEGGHRAGSGAPSAPSCGSQGPARTAPGPRAKGGAGLSPSRSRRAPWHCPAPQGLSPAFSARPPGAAPRGAAHVGPGRRRAPPPAPPIPPSPPRCPAAAVALRQKRGCRAHLPPVPLWSPAVSFPPQLPSLSLGPHGRWGDLTGPVISQHCGPERALETWGPVDPSDRSRQLW